MHTLKSLILTMVLVLLFCGQSFSADTAQNQWQVLTQSGSSPAEVIIQLLENDELGFYEVIAAAVAAGAIQDALAVTRQTESISMTDTVAAILAAGGVVELVKLMTPQGQLEEIVIAAIDGGLASDIFNTAIREEEVVNQEQLYVAAIENEATCLMAEALMTTGSSVEVTVTRLMQTGADAQVVGTCFGENVPGLGYTIEKSAPVVPATREITRGPVSAG